MGGKHNESLADYVRRVRNDKGYSQPEVERRSNYEITDGYISQIENGYIKNVSPDKLKALARGLGVSEDEIFAIARGKAHSPELSAGATRLLGYYEDSPADTQHQMLILCETLWRDAKAREEPKKKRA